MFYPLIAAILLHLCIQKRLPWTMGILHVVLTAAAFLLIVHFGSLKVSPAQVLAEAEARTNAHIQPQVYQVMASTLAEQRALLQKMYSPMVVRVLLITLALSVPYFGLLGWLLWRAMQAARCPRLQIIVTALMFVFPLALCALGHDTTRWIGAMCLDATLFVLTLFLMDLENGPVRNSVRAWADSPSSLGWMGYLVAIGPYGATGIRAAEQIYHALSVP